MEIKLTFCKGTEAAGVEGLGRGRGNYKQKGDWGLVYSVVPILQYVYWCFSEIFPSAYHWQKNQDQECLIILRKYRRFELRS